MSAQRTDTSSAPHRPSAGTAAGVDDVHVTTDDPAEIRDIVLGAERSGIDGSDIRVTTAERHDPDAVGTADGRSLRRPATRVALGAAAAATVVVAVMAALAALDVIPWWAVLPVAIGAAALGGLTGLYAGLSMHRDVADADLPGPTTIVIPDDAR